MDLGPNSEIPLLSNNSDPDLVMYGHHTIISRQNDAFESSVRVGSRPSIVNDWTSRVTRSAERIVQHTETVVESSATSWLDPLSNPKQLAFAYIKSLFPFFHWIPRYNSGWFFGDLIAGLTVGIVLVPQSMSYAKIATLPPEYGLYSSFVGVLVYCFFATSKDVSIGPVAVMSLEVARVIQHVNEQYPGLYSGPQIATNLAFSCGLIVLVIGMLRIAWIVDFIPAPALSGFMTGSAISISCTQIPGLFGVQDRFDTRAAPFRVIIDTLMNLQYSSKDAIIGIFGITALYTIRWSIEWLSKRYPSQRRTFFFISILRSGLVLLILTLISFLYCRDSEDEYGNYPIRILKTVPRGFRHIGAPSIDLNLIHAFAPQLPVATIILLLEHIAIAKSFGRINGYTINPNQELIGIGVTNTFGTVFSAYPSTGSFSRSALQAKSGSRTPAAGWVSCIVVLIALYALTDAFYWIPTAGLSAVIIHAVVDLVASPAQICSFWKASTTEFCIWWAAVIITVLSAIEYGIYTAMIASLVILLLRLARPRGQFLGRVTVRLDSDPTAARDVYVPLTGQDGLINPHIRVERPSPGILLYRPGDSITYPNASVINLDLVNHAKEHTRKGKDTSGLKLEDRPWNEPGPSTGKASSSFDQLPKPVLRAIILDFSAVSQVDTSGLQSLLDAQNEIERYVDGAVDFHFAGILTPSIQRALIASGFGTGDREEEFPYEIAASFPGARSAEGFTPEYEAKGRMGAVFSPEDVEGIDRADAGSSNYSPDFGGPFCPVVAPSTPFFHLDLDSVVRIAEFGLRPHI